MPILSANGIGGVHKDIFTKLGGIHFGVGAFLLLIYHLSF